MAMSNSMEDYLESIYMLKKEKDKVRNKELAKKLNVRLSSATEAVQKLAEKKMVKYQKYGSIEITKKGEQKARNIYNRHKLLSKFFVEVLGIDKRIAEEDACKIEHLLSQSTINKITNFLEGR